MSYRIGSCLLDEERSLVLGPDGVVSDSAQVVRVLRVLAEERRAGDHFMTTAELQQRAWGKVSVGTDAVRKALDRVESVLRAAGAPAALERVYGGRIRLRPATEVVLEGPERASARSASGRPALLVLPLQCVGLAEDAGDLLGARVTGMLSGEWDTRDFDPGRRLGVHDASGLCALRQELDIRFLVRGAVESGSHGLRACGEVLDLDSGAVLSRASAELPGAHDEADLDSLGQILGLRTNRSLIEAVLRQLSARAVDAGSVYERIMSSIGRIFTLERSEVLGATEELQAVIPASGPDASDAWMFLALARYYNYWSDPRRLQVEARAAMDRVADASINADAASTAALRANIESWCGNHDSAAALARTAAGVAGDPSFSSWLRSVALVDLGHTQEALTLIQRSLDLMPRHHMSFHIHHTRALAYLTLGDVDAAIRSGWQSYVLHPGFADAPVLLAAAYAGAGRLDAARRALELLPPDIRPEHVRALHFCRGQAWERPVHDGLGRLGVRA